MGAMEVDLVVCASLTIDVKSKERIAESELRSPRGLAEELPQMRKMVVAGEKFCRTTHDGIEIIPVKESLQEVWQNNLLPPVASYGAEPNPYLY